MTLYGDALPDFPWDSLAEAKARASEHPDGLVDLSVGTPVDPTPEVVQEALAAASDAPGYPTTHGTAELRQAVVDWFARRRGVPELDPAAVLPTVGSKELVALLPALLGVGAGDVVVHPEVAYPTYDVGARLAGAIPVAADDLSAIQQSSPKVVWLNSPSNPTGRVLDVAHLRAVVEWARAHGALVVSDECYAELGWSERYRRGAPSLLDPEVSGGSSEGLLVVYSLSKQSSMAGYRAAFTAGDPTVISRLLEIRKHMGLIMPAPVQRAMTIALADDAHVNLQRERYGARRRRLLAACTAAGLEVSADCEAGLYLWARSASRPERQARELVAELAERGILVAPGSFYGPAGDHHVRIALTASDERVQAAAQRLVERPLAG